MKNNRPLLLKIYDNIFFPQEIFDVLVDNEIRKVSKGSAKIIVEKAEKICAIQLLYDVKRLDNISVIRNQITHENTPSKKTICIGIKSPKMKIKLWKIVKII